MTLPLNRLNCVLRATDAAHIDAVTNWLRVSARVGEITTCENDTELRDELQLREPGDSPDFIIVVVSGDELPPHLLRYPDLKVLVLTARRKVGPLTPWLQQGACDVATLARPQQVQHALSRLIDECAMDRRVGLLAEELNRSEARYSTLVRNSRTPLSFWRDDELLACSPDFSVITGLSEGASSKDWLSQLDLYSRTMLGQNIDSWPAQVRATVSEHNQPIRIDREPSCECSDDNEHLLSVKLVIAPAATSNATDTSIIEASVTSTRPINSLNDVALNDVALNSIPTLTKNVPMPETDSVSGLPARQTIVNNFQSWLQVATNNSRYVAMTVDLSDTRSTEYTKSDTTDECVSDDEISPVVKAATSAIDQTLQDLAVYRAADRLSRTLSSDTLLGRLNNDCLLIIRELDANEAPRLLAKGIRRSLGSLGGLIGSPNAVRINTVNISAQSGTSAEGLVTRLENR